MLPRNHPDRIQITFDDRRLVANAGLLLPATLARHLGLPEMLPRNHPDRIQITFDDRRLVANAGLLLPATLARHLGLPELVRRPPYPKWNPGYFPCSSLTPLPLSSRRPSVSFGGFGLIHRLKLKGRSFRSAPLQNFKSPPLHGD